MATNIKTKHIELTPELRDIITKKVSAFDKLVDLNDSSLILDIEIGKATEHHQNGDIYRAEFNIFYKGKTYRAVAERGDLQTAIDEAQGTMLHELRQGKSERISALRKGGMMVKEMLRKFYK